ncbi:hypothetical protein V5799_032555 [Amblyomma americanum]|uniref:Uncharacterized protein n=1 Tax=Amblyomma americanum TaxID=6943 RepID=A0AAQ4DQU2_AMBAM
MDELRPLTLEPKPQVQTVCQVKRPASNPQELGFHELEQRLEHGGLYSNGLESAETGGCQPSSKSEMQIMKIVQKVKRELPHIPEQEIRQHVDDLRSSQGGFSRMTLNSIVALALSHIKIATRANS